MPERSAVEAGAGTAAGPGLFRKLLAMRELSLIIIMALLFIFLSFATDTFIRPANLRVLLQGMSVDMMIAIPMAISLIAGNIDFSVGSTLCLSSVVAGLAMNNGSGTVLGVLVGLAVGAAAGLLNGVIINRFGVIPMVVTLGTWMAYRGLALVVISGNTIANLPSSFKAIGRTEVLGIPAPLIYMAVIILVGMFVIKYVHFFHQSYFIGSNKASARLAGFNIKRFVYITYVITGLVAAFAGLVLASRLGSASQNAGQGLEFRNVVALLVGGISFDGGEGTILGAALGVTLMQMVNNALVLLDINPNYTQVIIGGILVASVALDRMNKART